ncbi:hypothetical protein BV898_01271 [Hypsibius exemplaris]|uniref:Uncharacterized protein n=1 Tax=Hypsibius exemplaris TaxID=2072580 RepID=A0A1W0XCS1_HYPEX|nr:hypothetical protein BV898_01271 [Hypsibius exemplaris]
MAELMVMTKSPVSGVAFVCFLPRRMWNSGAMRSSDCRCCLIMGYRLQWVTSFAAPGEFRRPGKKCTDPSGPRECVTVTDRVRRVALWGARKVDG